MARGMVERVENKPSVRIAAAALAAIAALAILPTFSALFMGLAFGWLTFVYGLGLIFAAAFNLVSSLEVFQNKRTGVALLPVVVIMMLICIAHLLILVVFA